MNNRSIAKRYATSLFAIAKETKKVNEIKEQMGVLRVAFGQDGQIIDLLTVPRMSLTKKKEIFSSIVKGTDESLQNTLLLMIEKKYIHYWKELFDAYEVLVDQDEGVSTSVVYSAVPLSAKDLEHVSEVFSKKIGRQKLVIENIVEPSLLGGLRVQIGNRVYDGTIQNQLTKLARRLKG
jgi:F-type H+-transporting ATPase subunit delta